MNLTNPKIEVRLNVTIDNDTVVNTVINGNDSKFIRNYIIYSLYIQQSREGVPAMQIYTAIETYLKENLNIKQCETNIRGVIAKIKHGH